MKRPPFYKSVYYAFKGLFWMLKTERNFQLEVLALVINLFLIVFASAITIASGYIINNFFSVIC